MATGRPAPSTASLPARPRISEPNPTPSERNLLANDLRRIFRVLKKRAARAMLSIAGLARSRNERPRIVARGGRPDGERRCGSKRVAGGSADARK